MGGRLEPLVVLTLLQLAVTDHHHDTSSEAEPPLRPRDPATLRDPHAERARVRLDTWNADVRMAVEPAEPAQLQQTLSRDDAEGVQRGVEAGNVVTLR